MKKITGAIYACPLLVLCFIGWLPVARAQNLVPNPGFEEYDRIRYNFVLSKQDFNSAVRYWQMPTAGTTDIFTNLVDKTYSNHPHSTSNIAVGSQDPKDGDFMIGLVTKGRTPEYKEYAQVELLQPLSPGQVYFTGFYISLADSMGYASNNIGMLFTRDSVVSPAYTTLIFKPQINSDNIIEEKVNWFFFNNTFTASEPYNYLTIGNFYTDENTRLKRVDNSGKIYRDVSYYFIDSVFVEPINELKIPNVFTPNGDEYNQHFTITNLQEDRWVLTVVNRWGQQVYYSRYYHNEWDGAGLGPGVYYYYLQHRYVDMEYKGTVTIIR